MNCFNSPDGMGMCLRAQMPGVVQPKSAAVEPAPAAAPAETAVGTPALDTAKPEVPSNLIAATFGLLRVEPDGSAVVTGSGTPGTEIEVYANGALLGSTKVEKSGDWVMVPDAPIAPGGTEITLGEAGNPARADKSFVVVINEDKKSEPLVVASTPGAASEVLQGLTRPATTQMAAAQPAAPAEIAVASAPATAAETAPAAAAATPMAAAEPAAPMAVATAEAPAVPAATATEAAPTDVAAVAAPAAAAPAAAAPAVETALAEAPAAVAPAAETAPAAVAPAPAPVAPAVAPEAPAAVAATAPAAAAATAPAAPVAVAPVAVVAPTIDAIEIDSGKTFFAGSASDGATIRLYVDDNFIADTTAHDGRWLVEAGDVLTKPSQRIRVDLLNPNSADVAARAEVNFEVDIKAEPTAPVAVATAEVPAEVPAAGVTVAPKGTQTTPTAAADAAPAVDTPAPQTASAAVPAAAPAAATPDVAASTAVATQTAVAPAEAAAAAPAPAAAEPATETVVQTASAQSEVPTLVATQVGDAEALRFASGKAIIRHGDNLWTIARRVYGAGIKYTTIYEANTDQIRDPDRIYPGQVFDLPKASAN